MEKIDIVESEVKRCLECDTIIPIINSDSKRKKFCNNSCSAKYNNRLRIRKIYYCRHCGKELDRKKTYCNNKCQVNYEYEDYIKRWKNGEVDGLSGRFGISKHIRRYMYEKNDNKCEECGWSVSNEFTGKIPLEIEHKDGNYKNNNEENLALLCPNCHALTSTYKGANKGNGRVGRHIKTMEKVKEAEQKAS